MRNTNNSFSESIEDCPSDASASLYTGTNSFSISEPKMPDVIQRKYLKLSSTLKETSRYLNDIDHVIFEHKNVGKQKNEEIFQLKADLYSILEKLRVADTSKVEEDFIEIESSKDCPSGVADEDVMADQLEMEFLPRPTSEHNSQDKDPDEAESSVKNFHAKYDVLNQKYADLKRKAPKVIQKWKEKFKSAEVVVEKQEEIIRDLRSTNMRINESQASLQAKVDALVDASVIAPHQTDRIGELERNMLFISDRHKIFLKEIDELKGSLRQENLIVTEMKQENCALTLKLNTSEKISEDLKRELVSSNESMARLQSDKLTFESECSRLQNLVSEKNKHILERDQRLEDFKKEMSSAKEKIGADQDYLNILKDLNNELDIVIELLSKNSKVIFQVLSCSPPVIQDVRVCVADFKTKFRWLQEEIRVLSLEKDRQVSGQSSRVFNTSHSNLHLEAD